MSEHHDEDVAQIDPTDLVSLARHATRLADDVAKVWSDALDPDALEAALPGTHARIAVLLHALAEPYPGRDERLEQAGIDVRLPEWPVSPGFVLGLDASEPESRWRALLVAHVEAVELLARATEAMAQPSGVSIDLRTGEQLRRWWESGAFALVGSRARLLERLSRQLDAAEAPLLGDGASQCPSRADAFDALDAAAIAYRRGDPEAALLHVVRAAQIAIAVTDRDRDDQESDWAPLRRHHDFAELADLLKTASALVNNYRAGGIDTASALPLARLLLPRVQRLIAAPPALPADDDDQVKQP